MEREERSKDRAQRVKEDGQEDGQEDGLAGQQEGSAREVGGQADTRKIALVNHHLFYFTFKILLESESRNKGRG